MKVTVREVTYHPGETIAEGFGSVAEGPDAGREVTFAGDWRPMLELKLAIEEAGEQDAQVEDWQVLRIGDI